MLDTIIYIPTILAYAFITLLVVILCFIVIYVSHKIYISIYDNLPVVRGGSSSSMEDMPNNRASMSKSVSYTLLGRHDPFLSRKSKTALRIIVLLEPCYLAYIAFESLPKDHHQYQHHHHLQQQQRDKKTQTDAGTSTVHAASKHLQQNQLVLYFDRLSAIPNLHECPNDMTQRNRRSTVRIVPDPATQNVNKPPRKSSMRAYVTID